MNIHCIDEGIVQNLKDTIENSSVSTNHTGYTNIMIKKILLASSATRYTKHTLCVAETNETEILEGTEYSDLDDFFDEECNKKSSEDLDGWAVSDDYKYDLYFETDNIFYFKDEDGLITDNNNKYYIGVMGSIEIESSLGDEFIYVDRENFEKAKEEYLNLTPQNKRKDEQKEKLLNKYTMDENGNFIVYKLVENVNEYEYELKKDGESIFKQEGSETETLLSDAAGAVSVDGALEYVADIGGDSAYNIQEFKFNVEENINMAQYALPIELLINMLDVTGSPEYVEEFIDYALDNSKIEFKAYNLITETIQYDYEKFKIDTDFVLEVYEMVSITGDDGDDNMKIYKPLIYDRIHDGEEFEGSIVYLDNYEDINYDTDECSVGKISDYLKTAYDPGDDFEIDKIEVTQKQIKRKFENQLQFEVSSVSTWYADIEYEDLDIETDYTIEGIEATKEEYQAYDENSEGMEAAEPSEKEITNIFIGKQIAGKIGASTGGNVKVVDNFFYNMFANDLNKGYGEKNTMKFRYFTARGLGKIAIDDKGSENDWVDWLTTRSDYIYANYTKKDIKVSKSKEKKKEQYIDSDTNLPSVDLSKVNEFLSLWKNETGNKDDRNYSSDGKKVEYDDIYKGKTKVGDIFESAPEMFFQLLEVSDNTRDLVDIFKYIMYVYTGKDYGITDASQIQAILQSQNMYIGSSFIIKTNEANAAPVLTREQLETAINAHSGQTKTNLLSALDGFMYIQETYNVNAVFAMAVARTESSGGTNWGRISSVTNNWMSVQGSYNGQTWTGSDGQNWRQYDSFNTATKDFGELISGGIYFGDGRYDVASIAQRYCPPGDSWNQTVITIMREIYSKAGVETTTVSPGNATGGTEGAASSSGVTTFTVGERTYKNYKQYIDAYKTVTLANFPNTTLAKSGCAITSVAIIASGFGRDVDPIDVNNHYKTYGAAYHEKGLSDFTGLKCTYQYNDVKNGIIDQLNRGYPVLVHVTANNKTFSTSSEHFFTILSISESGDQIYVSDPGSGRANRNGWMSIDVLNGSEFDKYIKME